MQPPRATQPRDPRYVSLDMWRGVAALMVVLFHASTLARTLIAGPVPAPVTALLDVAQTLWLGVPIFFVISGYCITAACDAANRRGGVSFWTFFERRARRIFPPYWAAVALLLALVALTSAWVWMGPFTDPYTTARISAWQWLGNVTLTERWRYHAVGGAQHVLLTPAWSLCYEEQFYAVCGVLLLVARRHFFTGAAVLSAIVACAVPFSILVVDSAVEGFFFDGRWLMFAAGILVYHARNYASPRAGRAALAFLVSSTAFWFVVRFVVMPRAGAPGLALFKALEFTCASAFAALILLVHRADAAIVRSRILRPIGWCGAMCYSLYLVHWPVLEVTVRVAHHVVGGAGWRESMATAAFGVACALAAGWVFHLLIERRFLNSPPAIATSTGAKPMEAARLPGPQIDG